MKEETFETNTSITDPQILIDTFFKKFPELTESGDEKKIRDTWRYLVEKTSDIKRKSGLPYYLHPMRVAGILAQSRLGCDTICSGLLHNILEVIPDCLPEIEEKFGKDVATICSETSKITGLKISSSSMQQSDAIRKMLFAMVDDIRVILV